MVTLKELLIGGGIIAALGTAAWFVYDRGDCTPEGAVERAEGIGWRDVKVINYDRNNTKSEACYKIEGIDNWGNARTAIVNCEHGWYATPY